MRRDIRATRPRLHMPHRHHHVRSALSEAVADDFRPDVEGLRALAVLLVVAFHAKFTQFEGGFIGVDVFFVVSGFLITRLLVKEMASSGTISLPAFWARRARRLLPAAALTLVVTLLFAQVILPPLQQRAVVFDGFSAAAFVANFRYFFVLGDYFGAQLGELTPSPLLHFWSLAVEEQFYLVWPATMLLLSRRPRQFRRLLNTTILAIGVASLLVSVVLTRSDPTAAFYLLPARMWELLAGAFLAVAGHSFVARFSAPWRGRAGWVGLFLIAVAAVFYTEEMHFPGIAAGLPVIGTMAVVVAGMSPGNVNGPCRILDLPALQWIGKHSYAIYLWHWPVLVLAEARHGPLSLFQRFVGIAVSIALSVLSVRFVEDPIRFSKQLAKPPARGLLLGAAITAVSLLVAAMVWSAQPSLVGAGEAAAVTLAPADPQPVAAVPSTDATPSQPQSAASTPVGEPTSTVARSTIPANSATILSATQRVLAQALTVDAVPSNLQPSIAGAGANKARLYADGCVNDGRDTTLHTCRYAVKGSDTVFVLYGDSHAAHWFPAMEAIATQRGAELVVMTKGGCPAAQVPTPTRPVLTRTCPLWRDKAMARIAQLKPALVVVSSLSGYTDNAALWGSGMTKTLTRIAPHTKDLVVLADNPSAKDVPANCLSRNMNRASVCNNTRAAATEPDRVAAEKAAVTALGGRLVDPTNWLCTPNGCPVIVGNVLMYRDKDHLTTNATQLLTPLLRAALFPG